MSERWPDILAVLCGEKQWALVCADNAEVLPTLPDKSVAHVITDPPYEAEAHTPQRRVKRGDAVERSEHGGADERVAKIEALSFAPMTEADRDQAAAQFARLSARWTAVFCQVEAAVRWTQSLTQAGAVGKRIGVWIKPDAMPQFSGDRPGMGYESIVFCHAKGRSKWNGGGRVAVFTHNKNTPGGAHDHETQKPLPLMLELVELFTDPDDIVLDPFAGSGTTGVACLRLGRRFIGIERDPKYAAIAADRLRAEERGQSLREYRAGQIPLFGVDSTG